jgi:hypothetical protein
MTLERISDLLVLLVLFYTGWRMLAYAWDIYGALHWDERVQYVGGCALLWGLAALHALVHLGR